MVVKLDAIKIYEIAESGNTGTRPQSVGTLADFNGGLR